ncbi:sigma-70 family RNA polymerase sigma factor [Tichowtungia aerotolerans]|uniref:Sigma-70 family RNA polymerase sigma factor n=1 Tax=Tichowtungia aerotolerans TaxID=2697043 RepID=A0A6P1M9C2_9BACT|nr:sigma-70 family RNA polymerase sigma factor [Tichowtungia aerotolerans]QHI70632.1 sigma-70 family RNA polymerase sigma factor [Tichowtungia aerotolerans]
MNAEKPETNPMDVDDVQLLADYRNGNAEALGLLVEKYKSPLFGFIYKFSEGHEDADEVFQEVWVRAIKNMNRYRQKNLLSWLFRIAHNLMIDRIRRRKPTVSYDTPATDDGVAVSDQLASSRLGPDSESGGRDLGLRIEAATQNLPLEQREVFWLRMQGGLSFKEIAKVQKCSINTALARMQYALSKLRNDLGDEYRELQEAG